MKVGEPDVYPIQVQGPKSKDVLHKLFGDAILDVKYYWTLTTEVDGIPVVISRTGWTGEVGYEIYLRDPSRGGDLWDRVFEAGKEFDIRPVAPVEARRIEAGIFNYGSDMTIANNPFEVMGLERLVEPQEADYIGKAALERIRRRGRVARSSWASRRRATRCRSSSPRSARRSTAASPSARSPTSSGQPAAREEHRLRLAADRALRRRAPSSRSSRPTASSGRPAARRIPFLDAKKQVPLGKSRSATAGLGLARRRALGRRSGTRRDATRSGRITRDATATMIVEIALISGVTPNRIELQISTGSVVEPTPALNDVMTRSSNDRAKASIAPAAMAGARSGSVTCRNAPNAEAPRSRAASSSCGFRFAARARTVIATYEMQNVMWASEIWPIEPVEPKSWKKNTSRLMPMMISGVIIGSRSSVWTAPEPRNRSRASPRPEQRAQDRRADDGDRGHLERDPERVEQVVVAEAASVPVEREARAR